MKSKSGPSLPSLNLLDDQYGITIPNQFTEAYPSDSLSQPTLPQLPSPKRPPALPRLTGVADNCVDRKVITPTPGWSPTIQEAITKSVRSSPTLNSVSVKLFHEIACFMGDQESDVAPWTHVQVIVRCALDEPKLREEIYMQVVRQLINNRRTRSFIQGWRLFAVCVSCFVPLHKAFCENLVEFMNTAVRQKTQVLNDSADDERGLKKKEIARAVMTVVSFAQIQFTQTRRVGALAAVPEPEEIICLLRGEPMN